MKQLKKYWWAILIIIAIGVYLYWKKQQTAKEETPATLKAVPGEKTLLETDIKNQMDWWRKQPEFMKKIAEKASKNKKTVEQQLKDDVVYMMKGGK